MFLRARRRRATWPDLSDAASPPAGEWLAPLLYGKTALAELSADEFDAALHALLP